MMVRVTTLRLWSWQPLLQHLLAVTTGDCAGRQAVEKGAVLPSTEVSAGKEILKKYLNLA